jgi:hypothetical protein
LNKKLFIIVLALVVVVSFSVGVFASETSVLQNVKTKLMSDIRGNTTDMLTGIENEVQVVVEQKLNQTGDVELGRATTEIQTYLANQLESVENHPQVLSAITDLEVLTDILIQEGKDNVDLAISNVFN